MSDSDHSVPRVRPDAAPWEIFEPVRVRRSAALRWLACFAFWTFLIGAGFVAGFCVGRFG